jgi:hypothetical protein
LIHSLRSKQWLGIDRDLWLTGVLVVGSIMSGLITVLLYKVPKPAAALMWTLACLAVGSLLGFVFGIPRAATGSATDPPQSHAGLSANTNIEQISDWLTKLLVGVGLVELKDLPQGLGAASHFVAAGMGDDSKLVPFAAALLVFFIVEGFLGGYLVTRTFFQRVFERSDLDLNDSGHRLS